MRQLNLAFRIVLLFSAVGVSACSSFSDPHLYVISDYMSMRGANLGPRKLPHAGVDFWAPYGSPALAAADGEVASVLLRFGCGNGIILSHSKFGKATVYCHLSEVLVSVGQQVKRGDVIGSVGFTGTAYGVSHVHHELCTSLCTTGHADGELGGTENPLTFADGCFDPDKAYPEDRLVLTYPIVCSDKRK